MRFFKRRSRVVERVCEAMVAHAEVLSAQAESNTGLLVLHLTTINSQILQLKAEFDKIVESQKAVFGQVGATQAAQAALLSAFADLLKRRPDIQNPPGEKSANPLDDIF